jgi:prolyl oligopeptidase
VSVGRKATPVTIIAEGKQALDNVSLIGGKLIASYLVDAKSEAHVYSLAGKPLSTIALPDLGTVGGFKGKSGDPETFFSFASFNRPTTITATMP